MFTVELMSEGHTLQLVLQDAFVVLCTGSYSSCMH